MPFATTGGKLHNVCPTSGRFGTETVSERNNARTKAAKLNAAGQQQQEGVPNPDNPATQDAGKKQEE
ncbi:hypothetical protein A3D71_02475 [Candidatus Kaiserbacteria bacterium RIFCSPHIGHO2_02_FULL_55_20]|uniref:Uncharacterized protein n=1 Tax=Candidatus Kaiserbacteria bacterium RIFCSPHIGHO2_02_FULL_55_20 TaxID=1798497 RepID=A0A1F6DY71_9BACT|nr:MAG: hypothetical protein A2680_00010 [Candidatus Kaiserbacteria bacterium RIFCSPHIGHO2_01_FULL_55_37]OGG66394.1 MAG: hypothetical protein A3D71_02475 [Candidatus Kaiserbacteria bacterium RIFCSPHIGHO2_02_FULL_55_20]